MHWLPLKAEEFCPYAGAKLTGCGWEKPQKGLAKVAGIIKAGFIGNISNGQVARLQQVSRNV